MIPDVHLASVGAAHVHAVETDADGRIYAGNDRGLLIYDSGGGNSDAAFLVSNLEKPPMETS
jgi:hypothetical protein